MPTIGMLSGLKRISRNWLQRGHEEAVQRGRRCQPSGGPRIALPLASRCRPPFALRAPGSAAKPKLLESCMREHEPFSLARGRGSRSSAAAATGRV